MKNGTKKEIIEILESNKENKDKVLEILEYFYEDIFKIRYSYDSGYECQIDIWKDGIVEIYPIQKNNYNHDEDDGDFFWIRLDCGGDLHSFCERERQYDEESGEWYITDCDGKKYEDGEWLDCIFSDGWDVSNDRDEWIQYIEKDELPRVFEYFCWCSSCGVFVSKDTINEYTDYALCPDCFLDYQTQMAEKEQDRLQEVERLDKENAEIDKEILKEMKEEANNE